MISEGHSSPKTSNVVYKQHDRPVSPRSGQNTTLYRNSEIQTTGVAAAQQDPEVVVCLQINTVMTY